MLIARSKSKRLYVGNMWFVFQSADYFSNQETPSPFQHYWSLGVEEQFYLVWPALIIGTAWLVRRARRRTGAHAASSKSPYLCGACAGRGGVVGGVAGR